MANARGGQVVLGVKERADGSFELHGLGDPERVERELWNCLSDRGKISVNLLSESDVEHQAVEGHRILVIHVPRAPRKERPVYLSGQWDEAYVRVGEGDRKLDRERARRMLADAEYDTRDDRVLSHLDTMDLHPASLEAYRIHFRTHEADHPWSELSDEAFLERLGARGTDVSTGESGLTTAGLLLLGPEEKIREVFPNYFLDYQERPILDDPTHWHDRITPDGRWSGNLFDFFLRVSRKLREDLKVPFALEGIQRRDDTHVHKAVREALVNCLVHADYQGRFSVLVVKSRDGFLLRNPGVLRLPVDKVRAGGHSDCRNRTLQRMFRLIGFGETTGAGFSRILRAWREQHWRVPLIEEDPGLDTTTLRLAMASLLPEEVLNQLTDRFGRHFTTLDEIGRLAVATAAWDGKVTNRGLQAVTEAHPRDLTFLLQRLVADHLLERHGDRQGAWYTVPEPGRTPDQSSAQSSAQSSVQSSAQTFVQLQLDDESAPDPVTTVAGSHWARRELVDEAIVRLCSGRFLSSRELANRLRRTQKTVARNYLPRLVAEGRLELKLPSSPHHPDQAYRTVKSMDEA